MSVPSEPQIYVAPGVFNQAIEFYWQPPISNGGSNITSYILESANISYISVLPPTHRKARVANLINQTDYLFTLKATNSFGNSNVAVYRSVQPGFAPERPSNLNVSIDFANIEPLLNISLTQPDTTNSSNITYNTITMYPLDSYGNIINNSSFIYERFSLPGQFDPITLVDTNTNYEYKGLIQSVNDVKWSKYDTFFNFKINPNLPTNNLKLWLDPYDLTTLTLSNNNVIKWNDKSFNVSNATISETFAPIYDSANAMLTFSGTQYMNLPANTIPSSNTPYSMFIYTTTTNINSSNLWLLSSGTPSANLFLGAKINNGNIIQSWNGIDLTGNLANFTLTPNLPILSEFTYDGNIRRTYINGNLIHSEIARNRNSGTSNNIIGSLSTLNANLIGSIGSIVLYDRLLTDRERFSVENYLINRRSELSLRNYGNLTVWLDANDNNTLYNSNINEKISYHNPVSVWLDKSNNNNHAFQSNTSIAPLKKSTFGKDYLNFNSGYMISNISTLPLDAFLIVQLNNLSNINGIIGISPNSNNYNSLSYGITANRWSNDSTSNTFVSSNIESSSNFLLIEYSLANNSAFIRRNGLNIANVTNFSWSVPNNSKLFIGNGNGINFNNSLKGNIGEIIMFNKQLNDNERFPIEGYLAWKWGIQNTLPNSHMFYNKAPSLFSILSAVYSGSNFRNLLPSDILGLNLWIDANDISTFTLSSNTISTIRDKSTNSYLFTGGVGFTYNITKFNTSYPSFYNSNYGSSNQLGSNGSLSINQPITAFYVGNMITGPFGYIHDSTTASNRIAYHTSAGEMFAGTSISGTSGTLNQNFIATAYFNTTSSTSYINGSTSVYTSGSVGSNNLTALLLGNRFSLTESWTGHICEVLFYNGILSLNNRQRIEGYLANKWGLQSSLPSNHPFKYYPPTYDITTFSPISIPGIQIWLDAMDSSTITIVNNKVTKWTDKVNSVEATNSNISSQPSYINNSIFFNGNYTDTAEFLDIPSFDFGTSKRSLFFIIKINGTTDHWFFPNSGSGTNSLSLTGNVSVNIQGTQILGTSSINNSQYHLIEYVFGDNTGVGKLYINGSIVNTHTKSSGGTSFNNATSGYRLGWLNTSGFNYSFNGNMSEILLFNTNVSTFNREIIEGYLAWKWNIQSSLPSIHPYKNSSPSFIKYTINYSIGTGGIGGTGAANGSFGTSTTVIINGRNLVANGGSPGTFNNNATASGGSAIGGDINMAGGTGRGSAGDSGGGGGGAIGTSNATHDGGSSGDKGADANDISGLFSVLTSLSIATANQITSSGSISNSPGLNNKGFDATGFGAGGGGGAFWGGDGGSGLYGGGGGGSSGYGSTWTGGRGGSGVIILSMNNGTSNTNVLITSGSSYTIPTNIVSIRVWVIGGGGGGSGATTNDGDSGGGGGAGGVAYASITL